MLCHDFHFHTHFLLSSKRPNTRSNHDMALSYLIFYLLSYLFTLQSHTIKTRKADSIGIPIKNYLLGRRCHDPLVLLIGLPQSIEVQLIISVVPTMRPSLVIRLPIYILVDGGLIEGQTGNLVRETDVRKRRRSRTEDGFPRNRRRRVGQLLDHPLEGLDASLEVSNLKLTLPRILSVLLVKERSKGGHTLESPQGTSSRSSSPNHREPSSSAPPSYPPSPPRWSHKSRNP